MRPLLLFILCLLPGLAAAISFDEQAESVALGRAMAVFEDPRGEASIDTVSAPAFDGEFRAHDQDVLNAGYSHSAFWLRVDLEYQPHSANDPRNWLLELAYPPLDDIQLYLPDGDGYYRLARHTGDGLPFASRELKQNNYLFRLNLQPGQPLRAYLRLKSEGSIQAPLTLWAPHAYLEGQTGRVYLLGIIYGVLLVMLFYNLFIFLSVRDISYLYYILYIASFGLYQVSVNGAGIQYFWPDNPWWANASTPFFIGSAALFGSQFARRFLRLAQHSLPLDRLLRVLMATAALVMLLSLCSSYAVALRLATLLALAFTVTVFASGVLAWARGMQVARYFILAWSAFLLGGLINTLMVLGYLPNLFFTMYASQIGSALEVGLLSLALADRINAMKEERNGILQAAGQKLQALNAELARGNRLKDEFLATLTHELRTPMNGVIGSLELLQTMPLDAESALYRKTAADSARALLAMIDDLLALTELQAGRLRAVREPFSLSGLLDALRGSYAARAEDKGLRFAIERQPGLDEVLEGDAQKLAQCLGQLLDNAIKFTVQGGVVLRVERDGDAPDSLRFSVSDSGIGFVTPADGSLYQHFKQLDGSLTRAHGGLGIGLALCRQLAELLGGALQHQSLPGSGSRFELSLPLASSARRAAEAVNDGPAQRRPADCRVLLVEDDTVSRLVSRGMLLKLGYQVLTVDNGAQVFELLALESVDALLFDCATPGHDAFATCRRLRGLAAYAGVPVLGMVGAQQASAREHCLAAGMDDCLAKPMRFEELQQRLRSLLLNRPAPTLSEQESAHGDAFGRTSG
jgi:signal transduction histidine kinase/CheY-like chemotaxis protein